MSEIPRRRLLDRLGSSPSLIAQHTRLVGNIETEGPLMLNGCVQGDGHIGGEIAISKEARWEGNLQAQRAVIAGTVIGDISVEDKLEIGASARVRGRVTAKRMVIAMGAQVEGQMVCTGAEPIAQFVEKRAAAP